MIKRRILTHVNIPEVVQGSLDMKLVIKSMEMHAPCLKSKVLSAINYENLQGTCPKQINAF